MHNFSRLIHKLLLLYFYAFIDARVWNRHKLAKFKADFGAVGFSVLLELNICLLD